MGIKNRLMENRLRMSRSLIDEATNLLTILLTAAYSDRPEAVADILEAERRRLNEEVTRLQDSVSTMTVAIRSYPDDLASIKKIHETANDLYAKRGNQ